MPKAKEFPQEKAEQYLPEGDFGQIFTAWDFPEFTKHDKGKFWYISFTVVFVALLAYTYFTDNLLFAIILVIFAILYFTLDRKDPVIVQIAVTEDGLVLNDKLIEYASLSNFYIIYYPPEIKNLYLQPKNNLKPRIAIPLEDQNPNELREILLQYLEEDLEKEEIPSSESISKMLKL